MMGFEEMENVTIIPPHTEVTDPRGFDSFGTQEMESYDILPPHSEVTDPRGFDSFGTEEMENYEILPPDSEVTDPRDFEPFGFEEQDTDFNYDDLNDGEIFEVPETDEASTDSSPENGDVSIVDLDGDGYAETMMEYHESGSGYAEMAAMSDLDGDGDYDDYGFYALLGDTDADGLYDSALVMEDFDGNGDFDAFYKVEFDPYTMEVESVEVIFETNPGDTGYDTDDTGFDTDDTGFDTDDTGSDTDDTGSDTDDTGSDDQEPGDLDPYTHHEGDGTYYEDLQNYDPENSDPSRVTGNPEEAMDHWEFQGNTNRCTIYSQMSVIEQITGTELSADELAEFAAENGWFDENYGASPDDMNKLIESYGIDTDLTYGNDISDIDRALANGDKVIVAIDADEIWYAENDDIYVPMDGPNHAVEVIGIDRTDPEHPMVILNDSGTPNGKGEMIPMDVFCDAWEDSSNLLVTARG